MLHSRWNPFLPVRFRVRDSEGQTHESNKILYFAECINSTLILLRALKNLRCVPEHWPLPAAQVGGLTDRVDLEEDMEAVIIPREPTPDKPNQPPFPFTKENIEWSLPIPTWSPGCIFVPLCLTIIFPGTTN